LSSEEVDRLQKEAEAHADEDRKIKESIEIRNNADNFAYQCEKQIKDLAEKISDTDKKTLEELIEKTREDIKGNDLESIKESHEKLQTKFFEITSDLYKQTPQSQDSTEDAKPNKNNDDVIDAEFEVDTDNQK